jgi:AcrR family transcriptional regulator
MTKTEKDILKKAKNLFGNYGYFGVSMSDIAKKLKITKAALYYYFKSKREIYENVIKDVFRDLANEISKAFNEKNPKNRVEKMIKNYVFFGIREKNYIKTLVFKIKDKKIENVIQKANEELKEKMEIVLKEFLEKSKIETENLEETISFLKEIINGKILEYHFSKKKFNAEDITKEIMHYLNQKLLLKIKRSVNN